jgi:hypothetical protein
MKRNLFLLSILILRFAASGHAFALAPGERIDNFRLLDQRGASQELYYYSDAKAVVLMVQGNGCPMVRNALPTLKALRDQYRAQGVEFLLINSNLQDDRDAIAQEAAEFDIDFPILVDDLQLIGESLDVTRTADVFVIDPKTWKLVYRGPIDDRLSYGAQKPVAKKRYLAAALDAMLGGNPVAIASAEVPGCLVDFPERNRRPSHSQISYSAQIAPLLADRCVACHRPGGIGPWAMTSYDKVRGFAPMIREVVRTKRMPPWHADPHYGAFVGDRSLSSDEAKTLVHWVEAGAPRGSGPDPLASLDRTWSEWTLGKPDLIVEIPAFQVPATGVIDYKYPRVANPVGHDAWVRAIEILPGDRSVVHHVLAGVDDPAESTSRNTAEQIGQFGGYAPGKPAFPYPPDTGILLRQGASFRYQMHYTPNGKTSTDVTRVGYYFADHAPKYPLHVKMLAKYSLSIPPNTKAYTESVEHVFDRAVVVYSLVPHAHLRGKASKFTAYYPDGHQEILLSVPKYDFNWQTTYLLKSPKLLPAGTRLVFDMTWDNSAQNPANPDPSRAVRWGDQTWDEMNAGWIRFRYADETVDAAQTAGDAADAHLVSSPAR